MANNNVNEQVEGLKALRAHVVQRRRTNVSAIGNKDGRIESIMQCQEAIKAIDEALADERVARAMSREFPGEVSGHQTSATRGRP